MLNTEIQNATAVLTMSLGKVNAMSLELVEAISTSLTEFADDRQVRAVIVAGNPRVFSAGIDLKRLVSEGPEYLDVYLPKLTQLFTGALNFPKPLVTAIAGHAVAGGCVVACTGDYRVISHEARIGIPELRVGVPFPAAGLEIMRWATVGGCFRKMINSGATFVGQGAVVAGLADESCSGEIVLERAHLAIEEMLQVPPDVFALTKRQMRFPVNQAIEQGSGEFGPDIDRLWRDPATRKSIAEYVKKRLN